jgi:hypothetical protein
MFPAVSTSQPTSSMPPRTDSLPNQRVSRYGEDGSSRIPIPSPARGEIPASAQQRQIEGQQSARTRLPGHIQGAVTYSAGKIPVPYRLLHLDGPRRAKFHEDVETDPVPTGIASNPAPADHTTISDSGFERNGTMMPAAETRSDCRETQSPAQGNFEKELEITPEPAAELEQPTELPKKGTEEEHTSPQIQELPEAAVVPELGGLSRSELP